MAPQQAADADAVRPGRPRGDDRESEILAAVVEALVAEGYDAMTIEGVAARAGAGKATLYRRWRNKAELVAEALRRHAGANVPIPDTGDVRADLRTYLRELETAFNGPDGGLMAAFTIERIRHPELGEAYDRLFVVDRRAALRRMVEGAVERGDLPPTTDVDLVIDVGPALMLRFFVRHNGRLPRGFADRIADQFLAG